MLACRAVVPANWFRARRFHEANYCGVELDKLLEGGPKAFDFLTEGGLRPALTDPATCQVCTMHLKYYHMLRLCMQTVRRSKPGALHLIGLCCTSFCVPILAMHVSCKITSPIICCMRYQHHATYWGKLSSGVRALTNVASCFPAATRNMAS